MLIGRKPETVKVTVGRERNSSGFCIHVFNQSSERNMTLSMRVKMMPKLFLFPLGYEKIEMLFLLKHEIL